MRGAARPAGLLVVLLVLAGCVSPPSAGPIREGMEGPVPEAPEPLVRAIANPPRPGMDPLEVVAGFLSAAAAAGDDFAVARQYLAPQAAADWNPGAGVTIAASDVPRLTPKSGAVAIEFLRVGVVSASGVLVDESPAASALEVPVAQLDGQWRITGPPPGLLLSRQQVARAFAVRNAYFVDPSSRWAVPDVRLVPLTGTQAQATALVTALLAGPSQWLADSVVTSIPVGLQLALGAVPVSDGVARIQLTGPQATLDEAAAARFGAQFAWTLRQVSQVEAFTVSIDGVQVPLGGRRGPILLEEYASFDPDVLGDTVPLYGLSPQGVPVRVDGDEAVVLPGVDGAATQFAAVAVAPAGSLIAGAAADRTGLLIGSVDGPLQQHRIEVPIASGPSIDGRERVWWTDPAGQAWVAAATPEGSFAALPVAGAPGPITLIRPARDGTRVVVVLGGESYLAAVVADDTGPQLQGFRRLIDIGGVGDVAWHAADRLTVLAPRTKVVQRIDLLGGSTGAFAVPALTKGLTDAPGAPVVLELSDGTAGRLTGSGVRVVERLAAPTYPG